MPINDWCFRDKGTWTLLKQSNLYYAAVIQKLGIDELGIAGLLDRWVLNAEKSHADALLLFSIKHPPFMKSC